MAALNEVVVVMFDTETKFDPANVVLVINPSVDLSQYNKLPEKPVRVKLAVLPAQRGTLAPDTVPPCEIPFTVAV